MTSRIGQLGYLIRAIAEPQYNIRLGCFFDKAKTRGFELSFDHTKYTVTQNQSSHITGMVNGVAVDQGVVLTPEFFNYELHNGANQLMVNYVQRMALAGHIGNPFSLQGVIKIGGGIMVPHAQNTVMGNDNNVGPKEPDNCFGIKTGWWRYGGYTAAVEYGIRFAPVKWVFIEVSNKIDYANMSDIPVYEGVARQELWMMEGILSIGVSW
jgi:hypothetical protein